MWRPSRHKKRRSWPPTSVADWLETRFTLNQACTAEAIWICLCPKHTSLRSSFRENLRSVSRTFFGYLSVAYIQVGRLSEPHTPGLGNDQHNTGTHEKLSVHAGPSWSNSQVLVVSIQVSSFLDRACVVTNSSYSAFLYSSSIVHS